MRYLEARNGRLFFRQILPADIAAACGNGRFVIDCQSRIAAQQDRSRL